MLLCPDAQVPKDDLSTWNEEHAECCQREWVPSKEKCLEYPVPLKPGKSKAAEDKGVDGTTESADVNPYMMAGLGLAAVAALALFIVVKQRR